MKNLRNTVPTVCGPLVELTLVSLLGFSLILLEHTKII